MNCILCVASISSQKIDGFLEGLQYHVRTSNEDKIIVVGLGEPLESYYLEDSQVVDIYKQLDDRPRPYAEVMWEKITAMTPFCKEETIAFLTDDDVACNPHIFRLAKKIFLEHPEVNYLSFMKGQGMAPEELFQLSGIPFYRSHSCMGNSMIVRWKVAFPIMQQFLLNCGLTGMFDQHFWDYLEETTGEKDQVYTIWSYSLMQHCNTGKSHYGNEAHAYAEAYDSRINPIT